MILSRNFRILCPLILPKLTSLLNIALPGNAMFGKVSIVKKMFCQLFEKEASRASFLNLIFDICIPFRILDY
jgi:hypothetical protein